MSIKIETLVICAPDLAKTLRDWEEYLVHEKNVSKHTLRAYGADVTHFITFLNSHYGKPPSLDDLSETGIRDFRSWMSRKAMDGNSNASRARALSGVKNFLSWLDKQGIMHNAHINIVRSPKLPHKLPRLCMKIKRFGCWMRQEFLIPKPIGWPCVTVRFSPYFMDAACE